jgi:hypothetical protein
MLEPVSQMPQQDEHATKLNHAGEVVGVLLPPAANASKVLQSRKEPLDLPAISIASQRPSILRSVALLLLRSWPFWRVITEMPFKHAV